jgi:hypothetical protein
MLRSPGSEQPAVLPPSGRVADADARGIRDEISDPERLLADVDQDVAPGHPERLRIEDRAKVIPVSHIESAPVFDEQAFGGWFADSVVTRTAGRP